VFLLLTRHHLGGVVCSLGGKRAGMMPAFCCRQAYNRTLKATFSIHTSPIRLPTESLLESRTEGWVETQQTPFPVRLFLFICATYVLVRWSCCFDRLRRKKKRIRSLVVSTVPLLLFGWLFDRKLDHLRAHLSDFVCVCVCVFWGAWVSCCAKEELICLGFIIHQISPFRVCYTTLLFSFNPFSFG
jgi:hypothetical protein